jgi:hypothetical protein
MSAERQKMYRRVSGQMVIAHFNGKLIACVNIGITPSSKSSR